jgi:CheY-like chemotaxis protein
MTGMREAFGQPGPDGGKADGMTVAAPTRYRILLLDTDAALLDLISEWLADQGCAVGEGQSGATLPTGTFDVVIVDMPFPRGRGTDVLARIRDAHRGTPIVVLSPHFFAGIDSAGAVARALGVARVLPMPVTREALTLAVNDVLNSAK